jgi:hypothetical protein
MSAGAPVIQVEPTDGGYIVKVGDRGEPILRTQSLIEEAVRVASQLGVEAKDIIAAVNQCIGDEVDAILDSPHPLEKLKPYLDEVIAGEDENKLLLFTLLLSGKVKDPEHCEMILLKSESGAGKSTLANALTRPFNTKKVGRFTEHALDYADLSGYDILYIQEIGYMDDERQGLSTIKFLSTDDQGYTVEMTIGNPKEGFTTVEKRIPPMTVISSTTRVIVDPQYERRNWIISIDETPEQTERIRQLKVKIQREKNEMNLGLRDELSSQRAQRMLKKLVEKIEPCRVIIPFPEAFLEILEKEKLRVRGDYEKIMRMLYYYCILKQRTLPKIGGPNGEDVVFATPEAALEILRVAQEPLTLMTLELDKRTKKLLDGFRIEGVTSAGAAITPEQREEIARNLGYSSNTLRIYLNELVSKGYITDDDKRPKTYRLVESLSSIERKASALSAKIENADDLTIQMRREALKELETLTAKTKGTDAEALMTLFTADVGASTVAIFAESDLGEETGQKQEITQDEPQFPDLRILLRDRLDLLCGTIHSMRDEAAHGLIGYNTLRERLGWDEETFHKVLDVAKRDRIVFEPRPGLLGVTW